MDKENLSGELNFLELGELLQLLGTIGTSGVLHLKSPWTSRGGRIDIIEGEPVNASDGQKSGIEALYGLFGWRDGNFKFARCQTTARRKIAQTRMNIIMDAMRMLDEGNIKILGPLGEGVVAELPQKTGDTASIKLPLIRGDAPDYSDIVNEERYANGQSIFMEGKFGRWVYVILDGKADVVKKTTRGSVTLSRLGPGTYPGTILFFSDDRARSASLVASGHVHLGVINLYRLYSEFSGKSQEFQALAAGIAQRLKKLTNTVALYQDSTRLPQIDYHNQTPLAFDGDGDNELFLIEEGTAYLAINQGEHIVPLANLEPGDVIGDMSFLDVAHRLTGGQIYGSENIKLLKLDPRQLAAEYDQSSVTLATMFKNEVVRTVVAGWLACRYYLMMLPENSIKTS